MERYAKVLPALAALDPGRPVRLDATTTGDVPLHGPIGGPAIDEPGYRKDWILIPPGHTLVARPGTKGRALALVEGTAKESGDIGLAYVFTDESKPAAIAALDACRRADALARAPDETVHDAVLRWFAATAPAARPVTKDAWRRDRLRHAIVEEGIIATGCETITAADELPGSGRARHPIAVSRDVPRLGTIAWRERTSTDHEARLAEQAYRSQAERLLHWGAPGFEHAIDEALSDMLAGTVRDESVVSFWATARKVAIACGRRPKSPPADERTLAWAKEHDPPPFVEHRCHEAGAGTTLVNEIPEWYRIPGQILVPRAGGIEFALDPGTRRVRLRWHENLFEAGPYRLEPTQSGPGEWTTVLDAAVRSLAQVAAGHHRLGLDEAAWRTAYVSTRAGEGVSEVRSAAEIVTTPGGKGLPWIVYEAETKT